LNNPALEYKQQIISWLQQQQFRISGERSVKLTTTVITDHRWLLGIPLRDCPPAKLRQLLNHLQFPLSFAEPFLSHLADASEIQIAIESLSEEEFSLRVYLEKWQYLQQQVATGDLSPRTLNIGFKWQPGNPASERIDTYTCHPRLTCKDIVQRSDQFISKEGLPYLKPALDELIINVAPDLDDQIIYLETLSDSTERCSIDLNLYPLKLRGRDLLHLSEACARQFKTAEANISKVLGRYADCPLGHISFGLSDGAKPFFTAYFEQETLN